MNSQTGTYALILRSRSTATVQVGRWARIGIHPGYYVYVGSAFGPGGVRARVLRHCRKHKRRHWHVDHLSALLSPVCAWYCHASARLEHRWANAFAQMHGFTAVPGFGCSDCACHSHLFHTRSEPCRDVLAQSAGYAVEAWAPERQARTAERR